MWSFELQITQYKLHVDHVAAVTMQKCNTGTTCDGACTFFGFLCRECLPFLELKAQSMNLKRQKDIVKKDACRSEFMASTVLKIDMRLYYQTTSRYSKE